MTDEKTDDKKPEPKKPVEETTEEQLAAVNAAADRVEAANAKTAELLERQEALKVEDTLGGEADAGAQKKTVEETQAETAKEYLEGTGLAEEAFPEKKA